MAKRYILELQRKFRKNPTPAEATLWRAIRQNQLGGLRFLRQRAFGRAIVDFYCASAKLVIELDGEVHDSDQAQDYDEKRTELLEARGLMVLRFRNEEVLNGLPGVLQRILEVADLRR